MTKQMVTAVILAGGQGQRMGGKDKGWVEFRDKPMISHVLQQVKPQVSGIIINANRSFERYQSLGYPVIEDSASGFHGPLMGMLTGLRHASSDWILFVPCDTPLLPTDLADRLYQAVRKNNADLAVAHDGERLQPVIALLHKSLLPSLEAWLEEGKRKIDRWFMQHKMVVVPFDDGESVFMNLNTPEELKEVEAGYCVV
ncbi:molybdenum cofactor guanylyltransferase MobA [Oceanospirillum sediminis]|uniref:Molybdenum cofactor guanylyltransferase n=1 Tax=Oceanospirillum sediminis TaxID=2760088 RepID=A0A839IVR9_9GAMM|nr:molybdenum cofactor guanylyltransferase MobA [Oceanospirillum sediminis]MBB1489048.1 molybdenum cofactor guanylyltransferase [Oceanospirillum sediminis]